MKMPFGKYQGREMDDVPASYLDWLSGQHWLNDWPEVEQYIIDNRQHIDTELRNQGKID